MKNTVGGSTPQRAPHRSSASVEGQEVALPKAYKLEHFCIQTQHFQGMCQVSLSLAFCPNIKPKRNIPGLGSWRFKNILQAVKYRVYPHPRGSRPGDPGQLVLLRYEAGHIARQENELRVCAGPRFIKKQLRSGTVHWLPGFCQHTLPRIQAGEAKFGPRDVCLVISLPCKSLATANMVPRGKSSSSRFPVSKTARTDLQCKVWSLEGVLQGLTWKNGSRVPDPPQQSHWEAQVTLQPQEPQQAAQVFIIFALICSGRPSTSWNCSFRRGINLALGAVQLSLGSCKMDQRQTYPTIPLPSTEATERTLSPVALSSLPSLPGRQVCPSSLCTLNIFPDFLL